MSLASLERRRFLKSIGLGVGVASLPFFSLLEKSVVHAADAAQPPLRLLLLHTGWGGPWDYLRPTGVTDTTREIALDAGRLTFANSVLEPLKAFASKMLVIEGLGLTPGLVLLDAKRTHLIGHENEDPNRFTGSAINDANKDWVPASPSLEYFLGKQLGGSNAVRSLQLGIGCTSGTSHSDTLSYNETGQRLPGATSPADVFKSLFGGANAAPPPDPAVAQRTLARRKGVATALEASVKRLRSRLAGSEEAKLDEHLAALVDIEGRIGASASGLACGTPTLPTGTAPEVGFGSGNAIPENTRMHFDILTQAFACDRTRYVVARWGETGAGTIPWLFGTDVRDMHGDVAHNAGHENMTDVGVNARLQLAKVNNWYAQQLAAFMTRLQAIPENGGTLLDNTLIVWTTDFGNEVHGGLNVPFILLGGAQNKFRMGRYLNVSSGPLNDKYPGNAVETYAPSNQLLVSIMNACGVAGNTFGSTEFSGPLKGLT